MGTSEWIFLYSVYLNITVFLQAALTLEDVTLSHMMKYKSKYLFMKAGRIAVRCVLLLFTSMLSSDLLHSWTHITFQTWSWNICKIPCCLKNSISVPYSELTTLLRLFCKAFLAFVQLKESVGFALWLMFHRLLPMCTLHITSIWIIVNFKNW